MLTLGIHDGHTATACLMQDGEVIACISEERLNRKKDWSGFPERAIHRCFEISGRTIDRLDAVGICSLMPQIGHDGYYDPGMYKKLFSCAVKIVPERFLQRQRNVRTVRSMSAILIKSRKARILRKLQELGIDASKVEFYEHHMLHAATAYYTNWFRDRKTLVVTLDGSGDAVCASINVGVDGKLDRVAEVFNYNSICEIYTRVTQYLGMKPMSHEYKVMGMAPYASEYDRDRLEKKIHSYIRIDPADPLSFINTSKTWKWQFLGRLGKDMYGGRFDTLSGAVQKVFEEVVVQWVRNAIEQTGVRDVALSGGGFMNVKLNYLISELPEVDSLFIFPSCGDESNPIGACILAALKCGFPFDEIQPLGMIYWGPEFSDEQISAAIREKLAGGGVTVSQPADVNLDVAQAIAAGKVVGRFTGRMEWGARALGNRSILADPRNLQIIHTINKAIKMRDFWMPFAPAILSGYRDRYLELRSDYHCPHMTIACPARRAAWDTITAGLHPFDRTARAQVLDEKNHPSFYDLVSKYEQLTGVGGVLNTSFNLHGEPIVCTPEDAIYTFLNSDLDVLQLENHLIEKPRTETQPAMTRAVGKTADVSSRSQITEPAPT